MLSKENILSKISSYDVLARYLEPYHKESRLMQGDNINNPFLAGKQETPSFNIFCALPQHEWRYKDFATGDDGSCFDLVMKLFNMDFPEALQKISNDFLLNLAPDNNTAKASPSPNGKTNTATSPPLSAPQPNEPQSQATEEAKPFTIQKRSLSPAELTFWSRFSITEQILSVYQVSALSEFSSVSKAGKPYNSKSTDQRFIFCYDHGSWCKLYKPLDEKKYKFQYLGTKDSGYLFGYKQLPAKGETVFLTGGEKDVMSLAAHGFAAFTLNSETAKPSPELIAGLTGRFSHLIILYDNDETGLKQSAELCKSYKLKRIILPDIKGGKDISDFFASGKTAADVQSLIATAMAAEPISNEEEKLVYDGLEIIELGSSSPEYLMAPIFPKKGTAVLAGKPDTGKSQIARQLCIHVALGLQQFIGFDLNIRHQRSLYVATEDGMEACSYLYQQQTKGLGKAPTKNIRFLIADTLEQEDILKQTDLLLAKEPADLVVVDSFGDIFQGKDSNNNMAMRNTVKSFDRIAKKHNCLILFVHHINKGAYQQAPGQEHIQGGAGLVQKVRLAIQLTQGEGQLKYFTVVKGNYCPREYKANAIELLFSEDDFLFSPTGKLVPVESLGVQSNDKESKEVKLQQLERIADEIFGSKTLSYSEFGKAFCQATGKSVPTAKRVHTHLVKLELIVKCLGGYKLAGLEGEDFEEDSEDELI